MSSRKHLAKLKKGVEVWNTWRGKNPAVQPDFSGANLSERDLSAINLSGANLSGADLSGAQLTRADLTGAILSGANLIGADLTGAILSGAILTRANLSEAILFGADLSGAILTGAILTRANLIGAKLFRTVIDEIAKKGLKGSKLLFDEEFDLKRGLLFVSTEEGRSIAPGATLEVSIADNEIPLFVQERILNAAGTLMEAMGYELEAEEEPKYGSFFQRIRYKLSEWITPEDVSKLAEEAKEALHTQLNKTSIETTATLAAATAELIKSLEKVDNAAIRLETLIVVKTTIEGVSTVRVENVSMALGHKLRDEPAFMENPVAVARFLDEEKMAQTLEPANPLRPPSPPTEKIAEVDEEDPPKVQT